MSSNTCGVSEHATECLCDVHIEEVTPINHELFIGGVYADYVIRAMGVDMLERPDALLDLMESCAKAKDVVSKRLRPEPSGDTFALKKAVHSWLASGESIIDAPTHFNEPFEKIVKALTSGKPSIVWAWSEQRWADVETHLRENPTHGHRRVAEALAVTAANAKALLKYYSTAKASPAAESCA